jgi:hypothetical protein
MENTARFNSTCTDPDPGLCTRCCRGSNGSVGCSNSAVELMPESAANTCTAANVTNMSNSSEGKRRCVRRRCVEMETAKYKQLATEAE